VEDNPGDVGLVREALNEHEVECELTVLTDGERAIQYIDEVDAGEAPCPELVILDLNLPRRPGREVLERMRTSVKCGHSPVVILSSSDGRKDREEAAQLGATRYLKKPSRLDDFMDLGAVFKEILGDRTQ
jgi:CheY-like chemotaxis protein